EYLQGAPVYVRVIDQAANQSPSGVDSTSVELASEVTGDLESLTLTETGLDTGVFEGSMDTLFGTATSFDGVLDTNEDHQQPFWWDVFFATYTDAYGQSSASARAIGSRVAFIDSAGQPASSYATGGTAWVRVEDQNANDPAVLEAVMLNLSSDTGDNFDHYLWETGKSTGIFSA
ncbi:MAG: hypothetical protein GY713_18300, partial [Actinomycetia bacterium]|nr:hypothetical protein [Actinomycetes bacterium]